MTVHFTRESNSNCPALCGKTGYEASITVAEGAGLPPLSLLPEGDKICWKCLVIQDRLVERTEKGASEKLCAICKQKPGRHSVGDLGTRAAIRAKTEGTDPVQPAAAARPVATPSPARSSNGKADPLRDWSEDVDGVPAERIRLCVRWKLDLEPEDWYLANITTKALTHPKFVHKLVSECPDSGVIEKTIKAARKMRIVWDEKCPHHCQRGKITFTPEGEQFPVTKHCECLHWEEI